MLTTPYWLDDYPRPTDLPVADGLPREADVVIVGAGYTGLAAARRLATAGLDVVVLDASTVGGGASGVNGGQINYGLKAATTDVFRRYGPSLGHELWDASLRSIDLVAEIVAEDEIACHFGRPGAVELAYRPGDLDELARESEWMRETLAFETELLGPERIRNVIGSSHFAGALVDEVGGSVHPARYVFGLARATAQRGVNIAEDAEVTEITADKGAHLVHTGRGTVRAGAVLMATNGYTPHGLLPGLRRRVIPIGSYVVATEPLRSDVAERLIPGNRVMWTARRLLNYFRRSPDDRILMGGRQNLSVGLDLTASAAELRATIIEIFPELRDIEITHSWTGKIGVTFDLVPHIGRIDGVWYAMGYGGHGVGIATYVGTEVGGLIAGEITRSPFAEIPHPTRWFYRHRTWFLPLAARWYRLLDRLGR